MNVPLAIDRRIALPVNWRRGCGKFHAHENSVQHAHVERSWLLNPPD
jgi:hypothetical protein